MLAAAECSSLFVDAGAGAAVVVTRVAGFCFWVVLTGTAGAMKLTSGVRNSSSSTVVWLPSEPSSSLTDELRRRRSLSRAHAHSSVRGVGLMCSRAGLDFRACGEGGMRAQSESA